MNKDENGNLPRIIFELFHGRVVHAHPFTMMDRNCNFLFFPLLFFYCNFYKVEMPECKVTLTQSGSATNKLACCYQEAPVLMALITPTHSAEKVP